MALSADAAAATMREALAAAARASADLQADVARLAQENSKD